MRAGKGDNMISVDKLAKNLEEAINKEFIRLEGLIDSRLIQEYVGPGKEIIYTCSTRQEVINKIVREYSSKEMGWKVSFTHDPRENDFILKFSH